MDKVALIYQPMVEEAFPLTRACAVALERWGAESVLCSSWNLGQDIASAELRMAVTFGGDGTILRTARWLAGTPVPIVGVQMGRLGFLAELLPSDLPDALEPYLAGSHWLDQRAMLQAQVGLTEEAGGKDGPQAQQTDANAVPKADEGAALRRIPVETPLRAAAATFLALNDIVVGRGQSPRTLTIDLATEGHLLHQFRCDGLIVATATGSTAYSFAAGGPILAPGSAEVVVTAICPHISALRSLVLPGDTPLHLRVWSSQTAMLTADGQIDEPLTSGAFVDVELSDRVTLFARRGTRPEFYRRVLSKLE
ncbi:MAG: hypothetical protein GEU73_11930 [Chloroflexi bacterium]|nr:hypothetical protein [Chloroflexota bacterium]